MRKMTRTLKSQQNRRETMNFEKVGSQWEFTCPCGVKKKTRLMPRRWRYKKIFQEYRVWSSEVSHEDMTLYCSEKCKIKDNTAIN